MATDTRELVLGRIRKAITTGRPTAATSPQEVHAAWASIPRTYQRPAHLDRHSIIELLIDRLHDYDAQVLRTSRSEVGSAVSNMLTARQIKRLVVPAGVRSEALVPGFEFVLDEALSAAQLNAVEGVLTECTVAIAETGTIVLQNAPGQGRRAVSLVPDYHLCLVDAANIVETVPEAMERLAATASLATTFISGPSATADIEMTRIKGVHGPRFLDVILIE
jgi:L-lactate dehydrogenase complex protein LldG